MQLVFEKLHKPVFSALDLSVYVPRLQKLLDAPWPEFLAALPVAVAPGYRIIAREVPTVELDHAPRR
jgi:hypothetical protein